MEFVLVFFLHDRFLTQGFQVGKNKSLKIWYKAILIVYLKKYSRKKLN